MNKPDLFSVPRRFDLFTVLVAAAGFAVLFTGMRLLDFPPQMMGVVGGSFIAVAIGQALAPQRVGPRWGSVIGAIAYCCVVTVSVGVDHWWQGMTMTLWQVFVRTMLIGLLYGVFTGYLVGVLVAGVFLVSYHLHERFSQPVTSTGSTRQESSPWDETEEPPASNNSAGPPIQNPTEPLAGKPS
jgi:H+/gluconate symporter-like permease